MHELIIDASQLPHDQWRAVCDRLEAESYNYSSTLQDKKIYIQCASLSQMADVVELIKEITDIN